MVQIGVDDGLTILGEAGRCHPDYRKSGVMAAVFKNLAVAGTEKFPAWRHYRNSNTHISFVENHLDIIRPLLKRVIKEDCKIRILKWVHKKRCQNIE